MTRTLIAGLLIAGLFIVGAAIGGSASLSLAAAPEKSDVNYFTIVDELNRPVFITGWKVKAGDQCLTADNRRYEIIKVEGYTAHARFVGQVDLAAYEEESGRAAAALSAAEAQDGPKVAIYHTHSDESYVPTDGKESIPGAGGVYKVGDAFAQSLKSHGIQPIHSMAKHDPHDDMAYQRSRRTVVDLLKNKPAAIFDIHRDAVPPEVYKTTVNGQEATKVQLVVGQYGPTAKQIEDFAMHLKAASDKQHPGLVKGIFFAKGGDYNQDLNPHSMLLEIGAHTNDRPAAERGAAAFADIIPGVIGAGAAPPGGAAVPAPGRPAGISGAVKSIGWILGLFVVGTGIYLVISAGGLKQAGEKLRQFGTTEFANFFGPAGKLRRKKSRRKDSQDGET